MIEVVINGRPHRGPAGMTVADAVAVLTPGPARAVGSAGRGIAGGADGAGTGMAGSAGRGIAVAVNGEVVRRADWDATGLAPGDQIEVLTAVQGG